MKQDKSIYGLADALRSALGEGKEIERPELITGPSAPMTRHRPNRTEPASEIVGEAREIVATIFEDEGTDIARRCAVIAREGGYDDDNEMKIALAALRRGVVIGRNGK